MFDDNICSLFLLWFLLYPGNITVTMHIQCHVGFEECIVYSLRCPGVHHLFTEMSGVVCVVPH